MKNKVTDKLIDNSIKENSIKEISLDIMAWTKDKVIWQRNNYVFKGGSINCIIGSSGSGKTTLWNYFASISHLTDGMNFDCTTKVNDLKLDNIFEIQHEIGFVPQFEIIDRDLTPFEYYRYICSLLNIKNYKKKIKRILKILNIYHVKDTIIGDPMKKGISGGELKRVCIGVQLLRESKILILDEPTTGLDSESSYSLIKYLKTLTKLNYTIILSIHQPSNYIINLIDNLTILSDGYLIYQGKLNNLDDFFFNLENYEFENTSFENILKYLDKDYLKLKLELGGQDSITSKGINEFYLKNVKIINKKIKNYKYNVLNKNLGKYTISKKNKKINPFKELFYTFSFLTKCYYKNKSGLIMKGFQLIFFLLVLWLTYNDLGSYKKDTFSAIQNRAGLMYFILFGFSQIGVVSSTKVFIPRKQIFLNEKYSNFHRNWVYYLCFQFYEIPYLMAIQAMFCSFFFLIFDFPNDESFSFYFFNFYLATFSSIITSYSIGIVINIFAKTLEQTSTVVNLTMVPLSMTVGFLCSIKDMIFYMRWIADLSNLRYVFQILLLIVFHDRKANKDCYTYQENCKIPGKEGTSCIIKLNYNENPFCNPFTNYNFDESMLYNYCAVIIFFVVVRIFGYIVFIIKFKNKALKNKKYTIKIKKIK